MLLECLRTSHYNQESEKNHDDLAKNRKCVEKHAQRSKKEPLRDDKLSTKRSVESFARCSFYYASHPEDSIILATLKKESIDSEQEAKDMLTFLNLVCDRIAEDAKNNVVVLKQPIHTIDAEKICDLMEDYIEEQGYEYLVE